MDTTITRVDVRDLDAPLTAPFGIATGAQTRAENLLVRIELRDGTVGHGEAAPFPAVNGETREHARSALDDLELVGRDVAHWRNLAAELQALPAPSARCAVETAMLDALCRHHRMPLHTFFGGAQHRLVTDVTLTTGEAGEAAARWAARGYRVLKVKVGGVSIDDDRARLQEIVAAAPGCGVLLDANAALTELDEALALLDACGGRAVLFEQPFGRDAHDRMAELAHIAPCPVAADESAASAEDVRRLAERGAAQVINLKATKSGLVGCLEMATVARASGLQLMMGAMVETPLGLTAAACLAGGFGGFAFIDLDTHLWMPEAPVAGGFAQSGPVLDLAPVTLGHGVVPAPRS